jgi:hypothetical protein
MATCAMTIKKVAIPISRADPSDINAAEGAAL